ncbi:MAG: Hsp20/alpha crystallin family protein [Pyrinomonadaceae bacterium]|nr:Hsp20/alpha crystallin family protein [Pyrinomonadaceae bacterium]
MRNIGLPTGLERLEIERLRARVGRLFAALSEVAVDSEPGASPGAWLPPVDLCESAVAVVACVELPGVTTEQVEVFLTSEHLRVRGKKRRHAGRGITSHHCSERSYGEFSRTVPLRWPISVRDATAALKDGLLIITLPKLAERRGEEFKVPIEEVINDK